MLLRYVHQNANQMVYKVEGAKSLSYSFKVIVLKFDID